MRFYFHYNKPASAQAGSARWTVHSRQGCTITSCINCLVPVETRTRKRQPRGVMAGDARRIKVLRNLVVIS